MSQNLNYKNTYDNKITYINAKSKCALLDLEYSLMNLINKNIKYYEDIIILCIGTDRATGDSLGPLIGYKLNKLFFDKKISIYGTLETPVHAQNLDETIENIYNKHKNPFVISIDSALGTANHISYITVGEGALKPGAGVNKNLTEVGNMYITGIVNISGIMDMMVLQNTRLSIVMEMADLITTGIWLSLSNLIIRENI